MTSKPTDITPDDLELKRVKEICAAMSSRSGPEYGEKLECMARLLLMVIQTRRVCEAVGDPVAAAMVAALGEGMASMFPTISGISGKDILTVAKAGLEDGADVQKVLISKLGL